MRSLISAVDVVFRIDHVFNEKRLAGIILPPFEDYVALTLSFIQDLTAFGIGVHHAGLTIDDRRAVEDLYLKGLLRVVVATSVRLCFIRTFHRG